MQSLRQSTTGGVDHPRLLYRFILVVHHPHLAAIQVSAEKVRLFRMDFSQKVLNFFPLPSFIVSRPLPAELAVILKDVGPEKL